MIDYDKLASEYARHRQVHPEVLKYLCLTGELDDSAYVLEVGCGTGNYIIALESLLGCRCWGVDPSARMLARAGERSTTVKFKAGQAEWLDYPANFFDLVFSVDVIHHVEQPFDYFREAQRVLKPGGRLCTATDSAWIIRHRQPLAQYFPETIEADLARYPPLPHLRDLMPQAGFRQMAERTAEFSYHVDDLQIYRDKSFSVLHLISEEAFQRGLQRMERDGSIWAVIRYLMLWGVK